MAWPSTSGASATAPGAPSHRQPSPASAGINTLLRADQEAAVQELSAQMASLMSDVEADLEAYLTATAAVVSQHPSPSPAPVQPSASPSSLSPPPSSPTSLTAPAAPADAAAAAPAPRPDLAGLSLLSLVPTANGVVQPSGRAQRRRQNYKRDGVATERAEERSTYKTSSSNSMGVFMQGFTRDKLLSVDEEQRLVAAAQDFMRLEEVGRLLAAVLKRKATIEEVAQAVSSDVTTLRARLNAGNQARATLAQLNYRLVVSIAKGLCRYAQGGNGAGGTTGSQASNDMANPQVLADCVTAGMDGLMTAMAKFKPSAGFRLTTYATWWIRQAVQRYLYEQSAVFMLPRAVRSDMSRLTKIRTQLMGQNGGRAPSPDELAAAAGMSLRKVAEIQQAWSVYLGARSLEAPADADAEGSSLGDFLTADELEGDNGGGGGAGSSTADSEQHYALSADLTATVDSALASLDEREAAVVRTRLGLDEQSDGYGDSDKSALADALAAAVAGARAPPPSASASTSSRSAAAVKAEGLAGAGEVDGGAAEGVDGEGAAAATEEAQEAEGPEAARARKRQEAVDRLDIKPRRRNSRSAKSRENSRTYDEAIRKMRQTSEAGLLADWVETASQLSRSAPAARTAGYAKKSK
ncbi:hypothetical protein HYH03_004008 [Edaphochlamys debaryana]|uniref:RNA polymerase sigma-70 region 2 domain-containing protein n=1 Tax=Edaphochlamys debaryana TaxID=47281 RepID=A0A835Y913_9CHLO|nr:hypothetical protein HYH03_004008 [Edaphochlamys debaryana]|eukprot:KAG2498258.1 hypothetical protein HYH03_004008 [Edaphochlamys debaryana]